MDVRSVAFFGSANGLFTVTANNTVYAFDAVSGANKWTHHLADPNPALRPFVHDVPSTPVIDIGQQLIFVLYSTENQTNDTSANAATLQNILSTLDVTYWLVALDLRTGNELRRIQVQAQVNRSDGSVLSFDARIQESHSALLLDHGSIYIGLVRILGKNGSLNTTAGLCDTMPPVFSRKASFAPASTHAGRKQKAQAFGKEEVGWQPMQTGMRISSLGTAVTILSTSPLETAL